MNLSKEPNMHQLLRHGDAFDLRDQDSLCVFHHIPKCAGSSFNRLLHSHYGDRFLYLSMLHEYERLRALGPGPWFVSGRIVWGCHGCVPGDRRTAYVTFLREPRRLFLSLRHFLWKQGLMQKSQEEYLFNGYQSNFLVHWLGSGSLALAKERLEGLFLHFGLVERMEDSLRLMAPDLGLTLEVMPRVNVSGASSLRLDGLEQAFLDMNALDMELYAWAEALFSQRAAALPPIPTAEPCDSVPPRATSWNRSAVEALGSGRYAEALAALEAEPASHPNHYKQRAAVQERLGRLDEALALYREGGARFPHSCALEMSQFQLRCGQPAQALVALQQFDRYLGRFTPGFPDAHTQVQRTQARRIQAQVLFEQGRRDQALATVRSAAALETAGCRNRLLLACFLLDRGETAAVRSLIQGLPMPEDAGDRGLLRSIAARLLEAEGDGWGAIAEHKRALAASPLSWTVLQNAVACARRQGEHRWAVDALRAFRRGRQDHNLLAQVDSELSTTLFEAGNVEEARDTALALAGLETTSCRNRLLLAAALLDRGEAAAARSLVRGLPMPEDTGERGLLRTLTARLLEAEGNGGQALAEHRQALAESPLSWAVLQNAVTCARQQGEHRWAVDALRAFRKSRRDLNQLAQVDRELSATLFEAGDVEEAVEVFSSIRSNTALIDPTWGEPRLDLFLTRVFERANRVLLLRAAPWVHFFAFLRKARPLYQGSLDVLTTQPGFLLEREPRLPGTVMAMPAGRFSYAAHRRSMDANLFRKKYDAVVVLTSNLDRNWYGDIFRLAQDIPAGDKVLYSMNQAISQRFRAFFLPLPGQCPVKAAATQRWTAQTPAKASMSVA
jgi:tetratricopeptide (TPR) repeat protein